MMHHIPYHLRQIAEIIQCTRDTLKMQLQCPCGCDQFLIYENAYTDEEKAQMKPYEDAIARIFAGGGRFYGKSDPDGTVHHYRKRFGRRAVEYTMPEKPPIAGLTAVKVRCAVCGAETVVFDNRFHGYDGAVCGTDIPTDYQPQYRQKFARRNPKRRVRVMIECTVPQEELCDLLDGGAVSQNLYSECFTGIQITAQGENGKYRSFFDQETA